MSDSSVFLSYLQEMSLVSPTKIQELCFEPMYEGKSIFALAPTGSGKTLAFLLPLLLRIDCENRNTQLLILVPTRELGAQIAEVAEKLSKIIYAREGKNILCRKILGGSPISKQLIELEKKPHVLIATPGRIIDILDRKAFESKNINTLVLDEADVMVGMGFSDEVARIYGILSKKIQVALFSATQNEKTAPLEKAVLHQKNHLVFNAMTKTDDEKSFHESPILHQYILTSFEEKYTDLLLFLNQFSSSNPGKIIIFCQLKNTAEELAADLKDDGVAAQPLTGDHGQIHRNSVMRNFKTGQLKYLVTTQIAARGLDFDKLGAVVHFDVPSNSEEYIHRTGRTGRSGYSEGISITFCSAKSKHFYFKMLEKLEISTSEFKLNKNQQAAAVESQSSQNHQAKVEFIKIHLNKGKKSNIRPSDILGSFIKELKFTKEDIGSIFIFDNFTHVEVNANKIKQILNCSFKVKNLAVKAIKAGN